VEDREIYRPDGVITFGILDAGSIPVLCDIGVDIFHQEVGGEDPMDEVSPDVAIIEVVLEQRWDLNFTVCESGKEGVRQLWTHLDRTDVN